MTVRSGPKTFTPMGVRMPVESMSIRPLIGIVQLLENPIILARNRPSISATSFSGVIPLRHSAGGLRLTTVSTISSGAGSVAVSARPVFANTLATSGTSIRIWSCCWIVRVIVWIDAPGRVAGMYSTVSSQRGGMNSLPRLE